MRINWEKQRLLDFAYWASTRYKVHQGYGRIESKYGNLPAMETFHRRNSVAPHPPHLWLLGHEGIISQLHPVKKIILSGQFHKQNNSNYYNTTNNNKEHEWMKTDSDYDIKSQLSRTELNAHFIIQKEKEGCKWSLWHPYESWETGLINTIKLRNWINFPDVLLMNEEAYIRLI